MAAKKEKEGRYWLEVRTVDNGRHTSVGPMDDDGLFALWMFINHYNPMVQSPYSEAAKSFAEACARERKSTMPQ